jgi:hypothetical protein
MKAILVTRRLKNKNTEFFRNNEVGDIVIKNIPNVFNGNENINAGGYQLRLDLHFLDGFKDVVKRTYNTNTQKLGSLILNTIEDAYTYSIIDLNTQQIEDLKEVNDEETARQKINGYREDALNLIEKTKTKMWRRVHLFPDANNGLTVQQVAKLERWFQEIYASLLVGNWRQARNDVNNLIDSKGETGDNSLSETNGMLDTSLWLQSKINDYFANEYDM